MVLNRIGRTERSGRYGSEQSRDESDWRDRRERDQDRDHSMRHWSEERRFERYEGERRGTRDSPEVLCLFQSDRSFSRLFFCLNF